MYGKNYHLKKTCHAGTEEQKELARELNITTARAEVYGIDCLAAGGDIDHKIVAGHLNVTKKSFDIIKGEILISQTKSFALCGTTSERCTPTINYVFFWHAQSMNLICDRYSMQTYITLESSLVHLDPVGTYLRGLSVIVATLFLEYKLSVRI